MFHYAVVAIAIIIGHLVRSIYYASSPAGDDGDDDTHLLTSSIDWASVNLIEGVSIGHRSIIRIEGSMRRLSGKIHYITQTLRWRLGLLTGNAATKAEWVRP
ncbi:unnamed protein product [Heligmosomoides polygyrus]|uniref:Secreted protein n=1 Tax=Heligmosomoides polygyrus TaxID=6339 RepID=A0A183FQ08_HELPZ|nr:unnamed protein product [Heligmosomoides polygyrus]